MDERSRLSARSRECNLGINFIFRKIFENHLVSILFSKRYPKNVIQNSDIKPLKFPDFSRPLTFLTISGFLYIIFARKSFGIPIPIISIIKPLEILMEQFPKKLEEFTLAKIIVFMAPFVLFVAIYSFTTKTVASKIIGPKNFKAQLNIHSYTAGLFAVIMVFISCIEGYAWDLGAKSFFGGIALVAVSAFAFFAGSLVVFRYLQSEVIAFGVSWLKTSIIIFISFGVYFCIINLLVYFISPIIDKLK